jgi:hypothetical protein
LAWKIKAGTVWVNIHNWGDAAMPFGGYKQSGWSLHASPYSIWISATFQADEASFPERLAILRMSEQGEVFPTRREGSLPREHDPVTFRAGEFDSATDQIDSLYCFRSVHSSAPLNRAMTGREEHVHHGRRFFPEVVGRQVRDTLSVPITTDWSDKTLAQAAGPTLTVTSHPMAPPATRIRNLHRP